MSLRVGSPTLETAIQNRPQEEEQNWGERWRPEHRRRSCSDFVSRPLRVALRSKNREIGEEQQSRLAIPGISSRGWEGGMREDVVYTVRRRPSTETDK